MTTARPFILDAIAVGLLIRVAHGRDFKGNGHARQFFS
jgi:hypothetical protein